MREMNHPNLIQLFAYIVSEKEGNFMIQEFMANGDLKNYLQNLKKNPQQMKQDRKLWSKLLTWCIEVARGMEHLDKLGFIHRDLAARSVCPVLRPLVRFQSVFAGMFYWTSFTGPRWPISGSPSWGRRDRGETSCPSSGRHLRLSLGRSSAACKTSSIWKGCKYLSFSLLELYKPQE
jgi:hypothetical protein